jgi:DNA-directed RNA polymerase subunit RPC12/RpoP
MLPTHDVDCPRCGRFLYSALSLEDVVDPDAPTAPKIEADPSGHFVRCPHCQARVAMKPVSMSGRTAYRLSGE